MFLSCVQKAILTEAVRLTLKKYEEIAGRNKLTFTTHGKGYCDR